MGVVIFIVKWSNPNSDKWNSVYSSATVLVMNEILIHKFDELIG